MTLSNPSLDSLTRALADAGAVHHDYEQVALGGERDELWPGFYAAFVIGRLGNFVSSSALSSWLEKAPSGVDWPTSAGDYVLGRLSG
jgi:hypothetical protein